MTPKHILTILCLALLLLAAPAAADSTLIADHTELDIQLFDHSAKISEILASGKNPTQKLDEMTKAIGYDDRLHAWMTSTLDPETGERTYEKGLLESILAFFGITGDAPYETEEEAEATQTEYLLNYQYNYRPTGTFGAPIV